MHCSVAIAVLVLCLSYSVKAWKHDIITTCYDGCSNGFVGEGKKCYVIPRIQVTWGQAVGFCRALGAELATIEDTEELNFLKKYLDAHNGVFFWIGAFDLLIENDWRWVLTDSRVHLDPSTIWAAGQPDNQGRDGENCAAMDAQGWYDQDCKSKYHMVCEIPNAGGKR